MFKQALFRPCWFKHSRIFKESATNLSRGEFRRIYILRCSRKVTSFCRWLYVSENKMLASKVKTSSDSAHVGQMLKGFWSVGVKKRLNSSEFGSTTRVVGFLFLLPEIFFLSFSLINGVNKTLYTSNTISIIDKRTTFLPGTVESQRNRSSWKSRNPPSAVTERHVINWGSLF